MMTVSYKVGESIIMTHDCGECGGSLLLPWVNNHYEVRCLKDRTHRGLTPKARGTRKLYDPARGWVEYDIMTQKEAGTTDLLPQTEQSMLARVHKAANIGLFPQNSTADQRLVIAQVALAYGLDPLMGELIPYQGRPYITIDGRRRLDAAAGHHPSIRFRPLTVAEQTFFVEAGALDSGDLAMVCVLRTEYSSEIEAFGRVLAAERDPAQKGGSHIPTVQRSIEMVEKRAEYRARRMAYGPVPRPVHLADTVQVVEEGSEVVEGKVVSTDGVQAPPKEPPKPRPPKPQFERRVGASQPHGTPDDYQPELPT